MTNFSKMLAQSAKMFIPPSQELSLNGSKFGMDYDFTIDDEPNGKKAQFILYNAFNIQVTEVKLIIGGIVIFEGKVTSVTEKYTDTTIIIELNCESSNEALSGLTNITKINKGSSLNTYILSNLEDYKIKNVIDLDKVTSNSGKLQKIAQIEKLGIYTIKSNAVLFTEHDDSISSINNIIYFNTQSVQKTESKGALHQELVIKCLLNPFVYVGQKIEFQDKVYVVEKNHVEFKARSGLVQNIFAYDEEYANYLVNN